MPYVRKTNRPYRMFPFDTLEVGQEMTVERSAPSVRNYLAAYKRNSVRTPDRADRRFTTQRINPTTTLVRRTS